MHIALLQIDLHIPDSHSLKDKRSVLKRLTNLIRAHHNVAVAEIAEHDAWQTARLGLVAINNKTEALDCILRRVIQEIGKFDGCELADYSIERL